ncbi:HAMP domain-containing protein, partial [Shewanella sp. 0m-11]
MNSYSLKKKILISVVLAFSIVIGLLSWQSFSSQKQLLLQSSADQVRQLGEQQAARIDEWLADRQTIINATATKIDGDSLNVLQQAQLSAPFELAYFGSQTGLMLDSDPNIDRTGYDPRSRDWYKQAMAKQRPILTKPYIDVAYNILVVTMAQPAKGGVVGGDLSIASLVDSVNNMKLPAKGYAIMMHKDGTVIAYKDHAKAMGPIQNIDRELNAQIASKSRQSGSLLPLYFESEGRDKLLWGSEVPNTDWELIFVLDKETLEAPLSKLLLTQLGLSALALLFSVLAISWFLSILLAPLSRVSQALAHIADGNGDLTPRIEVDTQDEVGVLATSFNRFVSSQH